MYVVTGATGNTGRTIAEKLLAQGEKVCVVGRDPRRLERFIEKGGESFATDVTDSNALTKAFSGAKAVYAMIPPNMNSPDVRGYQERVSDSLAAAIKKNEIGHVVVLSSIGADKAEKTGPVVGLHNLEKKLSDITGLNALYLRAGYFLENILVQTEVIQGFGITSGPLRSDLPLPMIATHDIGIAAAEALLKLDFQGKQTRELQGARDVTYAEVTKIIGAAIHKPDLAYRPMSAAELEPILTQMGMSANMADMVLEMSDALNSGYMKALEPRTAQNTTPTTIETFVADVFVPAYRGKAARA